MNDVAGLCLLSVIAVSAALFFCIKCCLMKKTAREIVEKLSEKLDSDTNTLIDISSSDMDMRTLADMLNSELRCLRKERRMCRQGDTELKEAVTNISHDLRTPLTAICGYLDLLERSELPDEARGYLDQIKNRTELMKQLTEELFRYSVVAAAKELELERLCVNDVLEESLATFYAAISERGIIPEIDISEERVERIADRSALMRIFGNIISNALKYSNGDFFVTMTPDGSVRFANSSDNIEKISVERLFDRFYTVETASNSTGLGLSIAKLLAEQMGGTVTAEIADEKLIITLEMRGRS